MPTTYQNVFPVWHSLNSFCTEGDKILEPFGNGSITDIRLSLTEVCFELTIIIFLGKNKYDSRVYFWNDNSEYKWGLHGIDN